MICPICGITRKSLGQHYEKDHYDEYLKQEKLVINDYKSGISPCNDKNCVLGENRIREIIHKISHEQQFSYHYHYQM